MLSDSYFELRPLALDASRKKGAIDAARVCGDLYKKSATFEPAFLPIQNGAAFCFLFVLFGVWFQLPKKGRYLTRFYLRVQASSVWSFYPNKSMKKGLPLFKVKALERRMDTGFVSHKSFLPFIFGRSDKTWTCGLLTPSFTGYVMDSFYSSHYGAVHLRKFGVKSSKYLH